MPSPGPVRLALAALVALTSGCAPDRAPPSPNGAFREAPPTRPRPIEPEPEPEPAQPPGPWALDPPPEPPTRPDGLDPAPLPAPWPVDVPIAGVDFTRTVVADEAVVGIAAVDQGVFVATASGGLFELTRPGGFEARPTDLPPLRGWVGGGTTRVACPADGSPARVDTGRGWARLDVGCNPDGRRTVAVDGPRGYMLVGGTLRDGAWPALERRRPAPVAAPRAIGAAAGRVVVAGADGVAASDDAGAHFVAGHRPDRLFEPRDVALTGKGVAVAVGHAVDGRPAIEHSRDGGRTWAVAEGPGRLADDLAAVAVDARGVFYTVPRVPGPALRSADGGRTWRAIDLRAPVGGAVLAGSEGALAGAPIGLVAGLDRAAPRGPTLERPLWRAVFTHPRVGLGVGMLGGLWRTIDGGRRWFAVPGTAGLPFTDLDRLAGHAVVAVGAGLFRRTDDAGVTWTAHDPPGSCEADWVRFWGDRGLTGCADGQPAISEDGGRRWARIDPSPPHRAPVWLDGETAVALGLAGRVGWCTGGGRRCRWSDPPAAFVELAPAPEGVSAIDDRGRIWRVAGPDQPWQPGPATGVVGPVAHRPLADGRALILSADALFVTDPDGRARRVGPTPEARELAVPGDGAVMVLQAGATTRFDPR